jgi:hypothetical protein
MSVDDESNAGLPVPRPDEVVKPLRGRPGRRIKARSDRLLPVLNIDFKKSPADQILPCSDLEQSQDLGWSIDDVRVINQGLGLYETIPMVCKGSDCFWATRCKTGPEFLFKDFPCPIQVQEAYTHFVDLVQELEVKPDDNVDMKMIADLVRIDMRIKAIDMQVAIEGQMTDVPHSLWQSRGEIKYAKGVHPLLAEQHKQRDARNKLYDKLIASREAKKKSEAMEGKKEADLLEALSKLRESGMAYLNQGPRGKIIDVTPSPSPALSSGEADGPEDEDDDIFA